MKQELSFQDALRQTRILRPPKHTLATFGATTMRYVLLSRLPAMPEACRRREGEVSAQRPAILTPEFWRERFEGFGDETRTYRGQIDRHYGDSLRALEYTFHNELKSSSLEHAPFDQLAERAHKIMEEENAPRTALLSGPDQHWPLSVMKFAIETSLRSFPSNVRELDERGLFNPDERRHSLQRAHIEALFKQAARDPSQIKALGETLRREGLFAEYEDRFFSLIKS